MSSDDFYKDPKFILQEWLTQIDGGFGMIVEHIDENNLNYIKQAFLDGYNLGFNAKKIDDWNGYNQK